MPFKGISYLELWQPFCSVEQNHLCNLGRQYYEEQFCEIILNFGQWFKNISYLKLWQPSCWVDWNNLCNFERGHHGEHSCEVR